MAGEFAATYEALADHTIVLDIFGAREEPGARRHRSAGRRAVPRMRVASTTCPTGRRRRMRVARIARPGDLVMTLSCGDVYRIIPQVLDALEHAEDAR